MSGAFDTSAIARLERIGGAKLVRQMIGLYLDNGPARVQSILDGVAADDAARVELAAHTLKSSAGNVGAVHLQHTAQLVETAAAAGTFDTALTRQLETQYHESAAALLRALEELGP